MVIVWAIFFLLARCQAPDVSLDTPDSGSNVPVEVVAELSSAVEADDDLSGFGRFLGAMADVAQAGRTFAIVPFSTNGQSKSTIQFANEVLKGLVADLEKDHRDQVSYSPVPLGIAPTSHDLIARIGRTESEFLFTGWVETSPEDNILRLHLVLQSADPSIDPWRDQFPIVGNDPANVSAVVRTKIDELKMFEGEPTDAQ